MAFTVLWRPAGPKTLLEFVHRWQLVGYSPEPKRFATENAVTLTNPLHHSLYSSSGKRAMILDMGPTYMAQYGPNMGSTWAQYPRQCQHLGG